MNKCRPPLNALILTAILISIPLTALADAGTPLMWASLFHLVIGNAVIGIFEGMLLAFSFKLSKQKCVLLMIPANYFSAWIGGVLLNAEVTSFLPFNIYNAWRWLWAMVLFTYLMTLILEWPFVYFCFPKQQNRLKKSLYGNILVNSLSYILLFSWYWMASGTTLYTRMNIVPPSDINFPTNGIIYYISKTNEIFSLNFSSHKTETIRALHGADLDDRLYLRPSALDLNNWDILDSSQKILIFSNLSVIADESWQDANEGGRIEGTEFNFNDATKLAKNSDWNFRSGFWPIEGLRGENKKTGETVYFSLETPFVAWPIRNVTHLPGDFVIFQLGSDQICLLEVGTKKITLLVKGQGPVVVLPK